MGGYVVDFFLAWNINFLESCRHWRNSQHITTMCCFYALVFERIKQTRYNMLISEL